MYKRKRPTLGGYTIATYGNGKYTRKSPAKKRPYVRRNALVPGKSRIGGFYGRFPPVGGETKFFDLDVNVAPVLIAGSITDSLHKIDQGVGESQRVGRKCTITAIHWRYQISLPTLTDVGAPLGGDTIRILMYLDKQCNGEIATVAGILETADWQDFRNLANTNRFTILCDKVHDVNYLTMAETAVGNHSQTGMIRNYVFNKKCNIPVEYSGVDGILTEIRSNNIGILFLSSSGRMALVSKVRLRFSDN